MDFGTSPLSPIFLSLVQQNILGLSAFDGFSLIRFRTSSLGLGTLRLYWSEPFTTNTGFLRSMGSLSRLRSPRGGGPFGQDRKQTDGPPRPVHIGDTLSHLMDQDLFGSPDLRLLPTIMDANPYRKWNVF